MAVQVHNSCAFYITLRAVATEGFKTRPVLYKTNPAACIIFQSLQLC